MNYENSYSLADIAAATGNNGRNNDGFGGDGSWAWVLIFLIFAFGGWGRNGYGFGGGTGSGAADNYVLASDFATLQRQIDSSTATLERKADATQQGLCDGFYAMNTGMLNGFSGVQQAMCQGFSGINQAISNSAFNTERGLWNLSSQFADCCCQTQRAIDGVNYNMAMNTNAIQNAMCLNTRDLIENQNANYRALHDELVANKLEAKNDRIAEQQNEINALRLAASQEKQNNYLVNELKPCPIPAYITCNPYQSYPYPYGYANNGCGCNTGCNCGNY